MVDSWPVLGIGPSFFFRAWVANWTFRVCCFFFQGYTRELGGTNMFEHICVFQNQKFKKFHWLPFGLLKLTRFGGTNSFLVPPRRWHILGQLFFGWSHLPPQKKEFAWVCGHILAMFPYCQVISFIFQRNEKRKSVQPDISSQGLRFFCGAFPNG